MNYRCLKMNYGYPKNGNMLKKSYPFYISDNLDRCQKVHTELQIRWGIEDNSKIFFLISQ